ncbi:hypothetical protein ISCGN_011008 [Ixodes scapularis]
MADQEDLQQQMKLLQEQLRTQQELIQRQQQQLQQQQHQLDGPVQQHPANSNTTPSAPTGTAADGGTPAAGISDAVHSASAMSPSNFHRFGRTRLRYRSQKSRASSPWRASPKIERATITSSPTWTAATTARYGISSTTHQRPIFINISTELTRRLSLSEDHKVRQLIQSAELAECKSSQFLRHMRAFAGNTQAHDFFLRTLRLQRLPPHVQAILQAQPTLPLDQLAEIADCVIEVSVPPLSPTVQADGSALDTTELAHRIDDIIRQLSTIQRRWNPVDCGNIFFIIFFFALHEHALTCSCARELTGTITSTSKIDVSTDAGRTRLDPKELRP